MVRRGGEAIELTTVEFDLLEALLRNAGPRHPARRARAHGAEQVRFHRSIAASTPTSATCAASSVPAPDGLDRIKSLRGIGYQYTLRHPSGAVEK